MTKASETTPRIRRPQSSTVTRTQKVTSATLSSPRTTHLHFSRRKTDRAPVKLDSPLERPPAARCRAGVFFMRPRHGYCCVLPNSASFEAHTENEYGPDYCRPIRYV